MPWCHSNIASFHFRVALNTYATCTWKIMHLVKLWHLGLHRYLGLTQTSRHVGLILAMNFPSALRPCHLGLPSPVFRPNHKLHLVRGLRALKPPQWAPFLKPSLADTYVAHEHVKLGVEPNPTLRFLPKPPQRPPHGGPNLGFK
jgi:hypothetical protein